MQIIVSEFRVESCVYPSLDAAFHQRRLTLRRHNMNKADTMEFKLFCAYVFILTLAYWNLKDDAVVDVSA